MPRDDYDYMRDEGRVGRARRKPHKIRGLDGAGMTSNDLQGGLIVVY